MRAGAAWLGEISPLLTQTELIFLHIKGAAGLSLFKISISNMSWCIHSILKQDGVKKEADKQMIARRRSNLTLAYKDTLAITKIDYFSL